MSLKDGSGIEVGNRVFQAVPDRFSFSNVRYRTDDASRSHDLSDRHADGLIGHLIKAVEPPLPQLLPAAYFVQLYHDIGFTGLEIGRRVIKCQVSVLTDTCQCHIDMVAPDDLS
jgi:hypothetical protein